MDVELLVFRLLHVMGGIFWLGTAAAITLFVAPSASESGPAGGAVMAALGRRGAFIAIPVVAMVTMLSGFWLMQISPDVQTESYVASWTGEAYFVGIVFALLSFIIGVFVVRRTNLRIGRLSARRENALPEERLAIDVEISVLRSSGTWWSRVALACVTVSAVTMAVGRYL